MIGWEKQVSIQLKIDILVRLEPRWESVVARNAWWIDNVKVETNERSVFSSMFSLFQREKCENYMQHLLHKEDINFNVFSS